MKPTNFPTRQKTKRLKALENLKANRTKGSKADQERKEREIKVLEERTR